MFLVTLFLTLSNLSYQPVVPTTIGVLASIHVLILLSAKSLSKADGGTIYSVTENKTLRFEVLFNDSLKMKLGGTSGSAISFPEIPIFIDGKPNENALVAYAVAHDNIINIEDYSYIK